MSSEVIGFLIHAHRAAQSMGSMLRVCCPTVLNRGVLAEARLNRVLPIFETLSEALDDFERLPD
jgi:hypothetical protein